MNFCSHCGSDIVRSIPEDDNRERCICINVACGIIHYHNPRIITGCLPIYQDKVLLCKRAIEPKYGLWTLPAGFMENGETTEQGAVRESWEEAKVSLKVEQLYSLYNLPYINQVYFFYKATMTEATFESTSESLEVRLFSEEEIPWESIAFVVVEKTLRHYFEDRKMGQYPLHQENISKRR